MRAMPARLGAIALLLAWPALIQTAQQKLAVSVDVVPGTPTVNKRVEFRAAVTPPGSTTWRYQFHLDGVRLTKCKPESSVCEWTVETPGEHLVYVVVDAPSLARGGRGSPRVFTERRFVVQPAPAPPVTPDKPPGTGAPQPELKVTLLSPKVVAGEPARFSVSLINATPLEYAIDMGDGKVETRTDAEFTHIYKESGDVKVVARFPAGAPVIESTLPIRIEADPLATPIAYTLRVVPTEVTVDTPVTLEIATLDGRPLTEYALDLGDGSQVVRQSNSSFVYSYRRAGTYLVSVAPLAGVIGTPATTSITVSAPFPAFLVYGAIGIVAVVGAVAVGRILRRRFLPPVATFFPHRGLAPRFDPSRTKGIALEVHYVPHLASLRFSQRVMTGPEE
jgi:PKD domain